MKVPSQVNTAKACALMWDAKTHYEDCFMWATLTKDVSATDISSVGKETNRIIPKGTRVIATVYSRFGDMGIRNDNIKDLRHGYVARVSPEDLTNWEICEPNCPAAIRGLNNPHCWNPNSFP